MTSIDLPPNLIDLFPEQFPTILTRVNGFSRDVGDRLYEECLFIMDNIDDFWPQCASGADKSPTGPGLYLLQKSRKLGKKPFPIVRMFCEETGKHLWKQLRNNQEVPEKGQIMFYLHRARVDGDRTNGLRREFYFQERRGQLLCIVYPMNPRRRRTGEESLFECSDEETTSPPDSLEAKRHHFTPSDHVGSAPKEKKKRFLPDPFNTPGSGRSVGVSVEGDKSGLRTRGRTSGGLLEGGVKVEGEGELGQPVKVQNERTVVLGGRHRMRGKRAARGSNQQRSQSRRLSVEGRVRRRPVDNLELSWEGIGRVEGEDTAGGNGHSTSYPPPSSTTTPSGTVTADTGAHDHTEREVTVSQPLDAEARSVARLSELLEASHQLERRPRDLKEDTHNISSAFSSKALPLAGREKEMESAMNFLRSTFGANRTRLCAVIISGDAGMGRTSFARHLVKKLCSEFQMGGQQVFVDLRGFEDTRCGLRGAQAMQQILQQIDEESALRLAPSFDEDLLQKECHRLLIANNPHKQHLLVLDNVPSQQHFLNLLPMQRTDFYPPVIIAILPEGTKEWEEPQGTGAHLFFHQIRLEGLDHAESTALLQHAFSRFGSVSDSQSSKCLHEMAAACQGRPLMLQALISLLTQDLKAGSKFSLPLAWERVSQYVNFSSPDWMGSILNFLSPLQKEVVMCLSIFRGRLSMAFPMLVSLLTGFINNNAENLGVFQLPSEESYPEWKNVNPYIKWYLEEESKQESLRESGGHYTPKQIADCLMRLSKLHIITIYRQQPSAVVLAESNVSLDLFDEDFISNRDSLFMPSRSSKKAIHVVHSASALAEGSGTPLSKGVEAEESRLLDSSVLPELGPSSVWRGPNVTPAAGQDTTTLEDSFFNGVACVMDVDLSEEFPLGGFSGEDGGHDVDGDGGCSNNNNSRGSSSINNTSSKNISNFNSDKNSSSMIMTRVNSDGFAGAGSVTGDDSLLPPFAGGASLYSRLLPSPSSISQTPMSSSKVAGISGSLTPTLSSIYAPFPGILSPNVGNLGSPSLFTASGPFCQERLRQIYPPHTHPHHLLLPIPHGSSQYPSRYPSAPGGGFRMATYPGSATPAFATSPSFLMSTRTPLLVDPAYFTSQRVSSGASNCDLSNILDFKAASSVPSQYNQYNRFSSVKGPAEEEHLGTSEGPSFDMAHHEKTSPQIPIRSETSHTSASKSSSSCGPTVFPQLLGIAATSGQDGGAEPFSGSNMGNSCPVFAASTHNHGVIMIDLHLMYAENALQWSRYHRQFFEIRFIRYVGGWLRRLQNAYFRDVLANQAAMAFEFRRQYVKVVQSLLQENWELFCVVTVPDLMYGVDFLVERFAHYEFWVTLREMFLRFYWQVLSTTFIKTEPSDTKFIHDLMTKQARLLEKSVTLCRLTGDLEKAKELGAGLAEISEYERDDAITYISYKNIYASLLLDIGEYNEAIKLLEGLQHQLRHAERSARNDWSVGRVLAKLAVAFELQGRYAEAKENLEESLQLRETIVGRKHPSYARTLNMYASLLLKMGMNMEAKKNFKKCLKVWKRTLVAKPAEYAGLKGNLGSVYREQGKYDKSLSCYQKSLKNFLMIFGEECKHLEIAQCHDHLGTVFEIVGDFVSAEQHFSKALVFFQRNRDHQTEYATALDNYAVLCHMQGRFSQAERHHSQALNIRESVFGRDHPECGTSLNNLANALDSQGHHERAHALHHIALNIALKFFGDSDIRTARAFHNLAIPLMEMEQWDSAEDSLKKSLNIQYRVFGDHSNHMELAPTLNNYGIFCCFHGRLSEAFEHLYDALQIVRTRRSQENQTCAIVRNNLGVACEQRALLPEAFDYYQQCVELRVQSGYVKHSQHYGWSLCNLLRVIVRSEEWEHYQTRFVEYLSHLPLEHESSRQLGVLRKAISLLQSFDPQEQAQGKEMASSIPCIPIYVYSPARSNHCCGRSMSD